MSPCGRIAAAVAVVLALAGAGCASPPTPGETTAAPPGRPSDTPRTERTVSESPTSPAPSDNRPLTPSATPTSTTAPPFASTVEVLDTRRRQRMIAAGSWTPSCPVTLEQLRLVTLTYWGFDGQAHTGELVLHRDAVTAVVTAMRRLYDQRFPIRRMVTVEEYAADDEASMRADNTSAFNGRLVEGTTTWSQHAYGRAIDINPLENPMVKDGRVYPATATAFVDRSAQAAGMIHRADEVVQAFADVGWPWGGDWRTHQDYQHFSANGR